MEVKLNQTEIQMLARITDPVIRATVEKQFLEAKAENLKLRAQQQERWNKVREEFTIRLGDMGHALITGLGNRFPLSLLPDQYQTLIEKKEVIEKFFADNAAEIARRSSPENRKAVKAKRAAEAKRKLEMAKTLVK